MQTISMFELQNTEKVQKLCAETEGPVFVTENGAERLVVMDPSCYQRYEQFIRQAYEAQLIQEGIEDLKAGRVIDGDTAIQSVLSEYGL